jgi:hypothetical protein
MPRDTWFYAEIIADHKPQFQWYSSINNLDFMDFPLTRSLLEAFSYNGWLSLLSHLHEKGKTLEPFQSVSFVTNHDVWGNADGLGYRFGGFEAARDELLAHLFVLGRGEGIPYLYSEIENGPSSLLRDENGQLLRGEQDNFVYYHRKPEIIAGLRFHNLTAGNNVHWQVEEQTHLLWTKGNHALMAINKSNTDWWVEWNPNWGLQFGDYYNLLENSEIKIDPKNVWIKVPARYALMLIKK